MIFSWFFPLQTSVVKAEDEKTMFSFFENAHKKNAHPPRFPFFRKLHNDEKTDKIMFFLAAVAPDNENAIFWKPITSVSVTRGFNFFIREKVDFV